MSTLCNISSLIHDVIIYKEKGIQCTATARIVFQVIRSPCKERSFALIFCYYFSKGKMKEILDC